MNRIMGFIQARMNSTRFPGKVLHPVKGKPLLEYLLDRIARCRELAQVAVLTSSEKTDDPIAAYCDKKGTACFRGSLNHVAERFKNAAAFFKASAFVRITADSPWIDPALVDQMIRQFRKNGFDYLSNCRERTFPKGMSLEILSAPVFLRYFAEIQDPEDQEHVTPFFQRNFSKMKSGLFQSSNSQSVHVNLCVDLPEDIHLFSEALDKMTPPYENYGWMEIIKVYEGLKKTHVHSR